MRRVRQCVDRAKLPVYERIIELYAPYVLVRCAGYTNGRRQSQQIGAYVLICTCQMSGEVEHLGRLGQVVDIMAGVVGPDVVSGSEGAVGREEGNELLIVDQRMREIARALNLLSRPLREVLVLRRVAGMEVGDLARLLQKPATEIVAKLRRGEKLLAERLGVPGAGGDTAGAPEVRSLLAQFAPELDAGWIEEVTYCAMDYLAKRAGLAGWAGRGNRPPGCWLN